jgi:hypothetical protein
LYYLHIPPITAAEWKIINMTTNLNTKPGIVLVTGAWHTPVHFEILRAALEARGYETYVPRLPTLGTTGLTWKDDAAAVQQIVEKRMDEGKEFVIAAHSYGGIPGCGATKGYTIHDRAAASKKGGFRAILFISAFTIPEPGLDLLTAFGGTFPLWMAHDIPYSGVSRLEAPKKKGNMHFHVALTNP